MSYETIRAAYRLWSSEDQTETWLAIGLVLITIAPAIVQYYRSKSAGDSSQGRSNSEPTR